MMKKALLQQEEKNGQVRCLTCAHTCLIQPGQRGLCGVRENRDGVLFSLVYGKAVAMHVDPIEKKPLFHFYPGTRSFSLATVGCNMHCANCQNAEISQMPRNGGPIQGQDVSPQVVVDAALKHRARSIAYTYTEPAVFWDYMYDTARLAHEKGLKNIAVTNGYFSELSLERLAPYLDGANVDLKSFRDETYRRVCGARLEPVLETIRRMKALGIWFEVTTLLIPGLNDSDDELREIAAFLCDVDPNIPWHVSRFHPTFNMTDRPATSLESIQNACRIGKEAGLRYVYSGNVPGEERESTFCHGCGARLIHRWGFEVASKRIVEGKCPECSAVIEGVW